MTDPPVFRTVAVPQALAEVESVLEHVCATIHRVSADTVMKLKIAVSEIVANIVEHATKGVSTMVEIEMWIQVRADEVLVRFADDGNPADSEHVVTRMPDEWAERGRGLAMARAVLSHLSYERIDDRNHWTLVSPRI